MGTPALCWLLPPLHQDSRVSYVLWFEPTSAPGGGAAHLKTQILIQQLHCNHRWPFLGLVWMGLIPFTRETHLFFQKHTYCHWRSVDVRQSGLWLDAFGAPAQPLSCRQKATTQTSTTSASAGSRVWLKMKLGQTAGFGPCFHFPGFHVGTGFLSHCHINRIGRATA